MSDPKQLDRIADPALLARIFRTFGEPDPVAEAPSDEPAADDPLTARLEEAVDRSLLARLQGRLTDGWPRPATPLPRIAVERPPAMAIDVDAAFASEADPGGSDQYSRPRWIDDALAERTPQAVLRDLHRPVRDVGRPELQWTELSEDLGAGARQAYAEAAAAVSEGRTIHAISLGWALGQAGLAEIAEILNRPWADSKPTDPNPTDPMVAYLRAKNLVRS